MRSIHLKAIAVMLAAVWLPQTAAWSARFVDTSGAWTEKYIIRLSDKGIIPAADDGKFNPNQPITRAQFADWLVKVLGMQNQPVPTTSNFADVKPDDWFFAPVEIVSQSNCMPGYADGFHPNQVMQRAEVMVILARTLQMPEPDSKAISAELAKYSDGDKVPAWAKIGVAQDSIAGILANDPHPQVLNPTGVATRGETVACLSKLDEYKGLQQVAASERQPQADPQSALPANMGGPQADNNGGIMQLPNNPPSHAGAPSTTFGGNGQPAGGAGYQPLADAQGSQQQPDLNGQANRDLYNPPSGGNQAWPPVQSPPTTQEALPDQEQQPTQYPDAGQPAAGQQQQRLPQSQELRGHGQKAKREDNKSKPKSKSKYLEGGVTTVASGTDFQARLSVRLNSGTTQDGQQVQATLGQPLFANGVQVIPAGSVLIGAVSKVVSAKRFHAGRNGSIDIHFTTVQTPDGRTFPVSASVDHSKLKVGGTTAGRVGKGLLVTGIGAAGGALLGTGIGAMVGAGNGNMGHSLAMGAVLGSAIGGGAGAVTAVVRKGSDVTYPEGMELPIKLNKAFQMTAPTQQPYYGGPQGGYGGPQNGYGGQQGGYGGQQGGYGGQQNGYGGQQGGYGGQQNGYGGQQGGYGGQQNGYGGQQNGYGGQPGGYGAPQNGYGGQQGAPQGGQQNGYGGAPGGYMPQR